MWEKLTRFPGFGNVTPFIRNVFESTWQSFTVTFHNDQLFQRFVEFQRNEPGTVAMCSFFDSNWLLTFVVAKQPHFAGQPENVKVLWGYGLYPHRAGNFVAKPMTDCTGEEIFKELCGHVRISQDQVKNVNCIPCVMPFVVSMFMPRLKEDRPLPVPKNSKNIAFVSQFVEVPNDVVFTVEYSVRVAQTAVY